ncbi:MAG: hypothetical protein ACLFVS_06765 [Candidatus Acetothermia bacterium]
MFKGKNESSLKHYYRGVILNPLEKFELVDSRRVGEGGLHEKSLQYRKTPLFDRFMQFDLPLN